MNKHIVYTSFDGDLMVYIDCMRKLAIRNGFVPINPEHALGYYLSTRAHGDSKSEVMKDCLSLTTIADEFWVFSGSEDNSLGVFPEGVLIEMLLWARQKGLPVKVFSIPQTMASLEFGSSQNCEGKILAVKEVYLKNVLNNRYFQEISSFLDRVTPILRPVVFIDIRNEDFKYVDWVRARAYEVGKVPIVPQHLIPEFVYALHNMQGDYDASVEALCNAASCIWAIYYSQEKLEELRKKYKDVRLMTTFISLQELNVPKYANPRNWSITTKELQENLLDSSRE
ncbi:MAG: hypothetical protein Q8Q48_04465 [Candidatus Staskawiczbacteria bacterium]|nr:hypothetical protein [Candidatus Staskawiczbacteria bacterium]